jgi:hypothetical protein
MGLRSRTALLVALTAAAASLVAAHCPNFCSGHGDCVGQNVCKCWDMWDGGDCSLRT